MDHRERITYSKVWTNVFKDTSPSGYVTPAVCSLYGHQATESEGHPFSRIGKTGEDIGGKFTTQRWFAPQASQVLSHTNGIRTWSGRMLPSEPARLFLVERPDSTDYSKFGSLVPVSDLVTAGTTAIARTVPTNPTFSAAATLGELREGLPAIPGMTALRKGVNPKSLSGEYLNLEFGIKPMLGDLQKFLDARKKADKVLDQLYRDSGRLVRRKYSFPPDEQVKTEVFQRVYPWAPGVNAYIVSPGTLTRTTKTSTKYWFSGAYTYLFPRQEGWHRKVAELEKTYGVVPDISDLYQLTPWSWAVDWFSNTGDLVSNLNSFSSDNLVLRYGYIMCRKTIDVSEVYEGVFAGSSRTYTLRSSYRYVSKQREKATPYGFGLKESALSLRQKAIISALGISRSGRR